MDPPHTHTHTQALFWLSHPHYLFYFPLLSYATIYRELERTILAANTQEDLKWFSNNHGPGMHMNWPAFEVWLETFPEEHEKVVHHGFSWLLLLSLSLTPGIQPRPGQRTPKEEETRRSPTHSEHWPCGSTWWSQQVSSMDPLKSNHNLSLEICFSFWKKCLN